MIWGDRVFSVAAPHLWNNLPLGIRAAPSDNIFNIIKNTTISTVLTICHTP